MKLLNPISYTIAGSLVILYFFMSGDGSPNSASGPRKKAAKHASAELPQFDAEDFAANKDGQRFALVNEPLRDAFKPLIARKRLADAKLDSPGSVPLGIAGEASWMYTGMAEVDGVPQALLENSRTQDGVFLKQGEKWKAGTVYRITPDELILMDRAGALQIVKVNIQESFPSIAPGGGFAPVNPPLRGTINPNNLAIRPDRGSRGEGNQDESGRNAMGQDHGTGVGDEN